MLTRLQQCVAIIALLGTGLLSVNALSDKLIIYKCTDPNGVVHFEMSPPKNCETIEKIVKKQKRTAPSKAPSKEAIEARKKKEAEEKAAQEAEQRAAEENAKSNAELCKKARKNLETLNTQRFVSRINEQGEKVALTEEERLSSTKKAQEIIDKYCQ